LGKFSQILGKVSRENPKSFRNSRQQGLEEQLARIGGKRRSRQPLSRLILPAPEEPFADFAIWQALAGEHARYRSKPCAPVRYRKNGRVAQSQRRE